MPNTTVPAGNIPNSPNRIAGYQSLIPFYESEDQDISYFFRTIDEIGKIGGWSPEEKLVVAKSKLRNAALQHLISSENLKYETDYDKFKKQEKIIKIAEKQKEFELCSFL